MRQPEGTETLLPGKSSERAWSEGSKNYIRNAEDEGSSPFTSTRKFSPKCATGFTEVGGRVPANHAGVTWSWFLDVSRPGSGSVPATK